MAASACAYALKDSPKRQDGDQTIGHHATGETIACAVRAAAAARALCHVKDHVGRTCIGVRTRISNAGA